MFESDADRESIIRALGGVRLSTSRGEFDALMDEGFAEAQLDPTNAEGTQPYLVCRSSDVERLKISKGVVIMLGTRALKVVRPEPDGTGMVRLVVSG